MMSDEQIAQLGRQSTEFAVGEMVPGTKYLVVSRIGQGGMGSVYEVEHVELGKHFVLKALLDQFCQRQDLVQRLRNEWRSLGRLEHPNIVSVSDAGVATNGAPYYVMERLQGESLAGALQRLGRFSLVDSMRFAAEVLEGLAAAHEIGIVHRDVKPPNIFITQTGIAKLLDFGIAKLTDGASLELTGRGIAIGTPRYMSPEQAAGERVDGRADLYAVGLVLFEMLSGCGPFDGCESHEVFLAHITRQPPRLGELVAGIPAELEGLVAALLAKRPSDRPPSAAAAAAALRSMLRALLATEERAGLQHDEGSGALTPLLRAEYLAPAIPGRAAILTHGSGAGNAPTAGVAETGPVPFGSDGRNPAPMFGGLGSSAPYPASSGGRNYYGMSGPVSAVPSTRTAPPVDPLRAQAEPTPSGTSRTAPGPYPYNPSVEPGRKRWLGVAALVMFGSGAAGWILTQPKVPAEVAPAAPLVLSASAPSLPMPPPVAPTPTLGVIIGGAAAPATVPAEAPLAPLGGDDIGRAKTSSDKETVARRRSRSKSNEFVEDGRSIQVIPAAPSPAPRAVVAPPPQPPEVKPGPAAVPRQGGRGMPGSGIGSGG